jgi:hypothetical protein
MAKGLGYAVRSQKEVAKILHARGVLESDDPKTVQWIEKNAFGKIRALWPELEAEIQPDGIAQLGGIQEVWPGGTP